MSSERGNSLLRQLDWYAGIPLAAATAVVRLLERPRKDALAEPKRVGIICLGAIGDLLLLSGLIRGLRQQLPDARLELILTSANANASTLIDGVDETLVFHIRHVWSIVHLVRGRHYDLLIDSTQWARLGAIVSNLSGARQTVGFFTPGQWRSLGYDFAVLHSRHRHEVENFLELGRVLWPELSGTPGLRLPETPPQIATEMADGRRHAFFHMWTSGFKRHLKEWSADCWARLAHELVSRDFSVWLTGSKAEADPNAVFLQKYFQNAVHIHSLAGHTSLLELAWLLARADAVVSVNTGIMHLAALSGAPTVGLHGPTNPSRWGPVGSRCLSLLPAVGKCAYLDLGFEYLPDEETGLEHLSVEEVLAGLDSLGVF